MTIMSETHRIHTYTPEEIEEIVRAKKALEDLRRIDSAPAAEPVPCVPEVDPVADMQRIWLEYMATGNVRHCHALNARSTLFEWECRTGKPHVPTLRPEYTDVAPIKEPTP